MPILPTKLSAEQVAAAALIAGWPAQEIPRVVAVAYGESGFDPGARNACCSGLMQIHRTAHADKIKAAGGEDKLSDPVANLRIAYQIWGGDWCGGRAPNGHCRKWEAYGLDNGGKTWEAKLRMGAEAYAKVQASQGAGQSLADLLGSGLESAVSGVGAGVGAAVDAAGAIAGTGKAMIEFGNKIGGWVGNADNWMRVLQVIGGGLAIMVGVRIALSAQNAQATQAVMQLIGPGGKAKMMKQAMGSAGAK